MRKLFLSMCAFALATVAMAQEGNKPENLALTGTATASYSQEGYGATNANDGNTGTRWGNYNNGCDPEDYLQIAWNEAQTFNTIKILCGGTMPAGYKFKITTSNDGEDWSDATNEIDAKTPSGTYQTVKLNNNITAKYVRFQGISVQDVCYEIYEFEVYNINYDNQVLKTIEPSIVFVPTGIATPITFTAYDENDAIIDGVEYSVENGTIAGGNLTATADGKVTISAFYGGGEAACAVYAVSSTDLPTHNDVATYIYPAEEGKTTVWQTGWGGKKSTKSNSFTLGTTDVQAFTDLTGVYFGINNGTMEYVPVTEGFEKLSLDVYSPVECSVTINVNENGLDGKDPVNETYTLKAGWNTITASLKDVPKVRTTALYSDSKQNLLLTNIYFAGKGKELTIAETPNGDGVYALSENASTVEEIEAKINDEDKVAYDFTKVKLNSEITSFKAGNPNAIFLVTKKQAAQLKGMNNLVLFNQYYFPLSEVVLADGHPFFTKSIAMAGNSGFGVPEKQKVTYKRHIKAGYSTTVFPMTTTLTGEDVTAYKLDRKNTGEDNKVTYTFTKVEGTELTEHVPYVLYSSNGCDITMTNDGTGDLKYGDFTPVATNVAGDETLKFNGTYKTIDCDGSEGYYALTDATTTFELKKFGNSSHIGAFRGYFTLSETASAKNINIVFDNGTVDGITNVNANTNANAACVYSIDGRIINTTGATEGLKSGLYIVNGKKVLVK